MNIKHLLSFLLIASSIFCAQTCKNTVEPPSPPQPTDTTSHNFSVLRIDTLGDRGSNVYAVDIIDENNIWAAGIFTERDSIGEINDKYNLARWDGLKWHMMGIQIQGSGGKNDTAAQPLVDMKVFSDSSIFVISGYNSYAKLDGKKWSSSFVDTKNGYIQFLTARSPSDIYFVGAKGSATHWDGLSFGKMPTGLSGPQLLDIFGNASNLFAVGFPLADDQGQEAVLIYCDGRNWTVVNKCNVITQVASPPYQYIGSMSSVYQESGQSTVWLLGSGDGWILYKVISVAPFHAERIYKFDNDFFPTRIRGNADNDLFVASSRNGEFLHYNGSTWAHFSPPVTAFTGLICVKGDLCAVWGRAAQGILVTYKRSHD